MTVLQNLMAHKHKQKNKTKQNKTKQNKTKQNKTKQNKTKQNKTKQNKTKQNKTNYGLVTLQTMHRNEGSRTRKFFSMCLYSRLL
jgi:hypothetical protein